MAIAPICVRVINTDIGQNFELLHHPVLFALGQRQLADHDHAWTGEQGSGGCGDRVDPSLGQQRVDRADLDRWGQPIVGAKELEGFAGELAQAVNAPETNSTAEKVRLGSDGRAKPTPNAP